MENAGAQAGKKDIGAINFANLDDFLKMEDEELMM